MGFTKNEGQSWRNEARGTVWAERNEKARRGEQNAGVNAEWSDGMLRGGGMGGGSCDSGPGAGAGAHFQASPYLDYDEGTTVVVAAAATRAYVTVSSDFLKPDRTASSSTIKIGKGLHM